MNRLEDDGRRLLAGLVAAGLDVRSAGWVQTADESRPFLYISTPRVNDGWTLDTYALIQRVLAESSTITVDLSEVKLVPSTHPVAVALARNVGCFRGEPTEKTVYTTYLDGVSVQRPVYVYPVPAPAPTPA